LVLWCTYCDTAWADCLDNLCIHSFTQTSLGRWSDAHLFSSGTAHRVLFPRILQYWIDFSCGVTYPGSMKEQWHAHQALDHPRLVGAVVYYSPWVMPDVRRNGYEPKSLASSDRISESSDAETTPMMSLTLPRSIARI
jgi:hypothetical protein